MNSSANSIHKLEDLPAPSGHWLLGHLRPFQRGPKHLVLENWAQECGDLFRIRLGPSKFLVSAHPHINGEILKRRPEDFRRHPKISEILEEMGVLAVFNAEDDLWRKYRKPTAEALNLRKVKSFYPILVRKAAQLLKRCGEFEETGAALDISALLRRFTTDVTTAIAFGYELDTLSGKDDHLQQCMEMVFPMVNDRMSAPLPWWRIIRSKRDRQFDESLSTVRGTILQFIGNARERLALDPSLKDKPTNFLEALLSEEQALTSEEVYSAVFTLLMAGEDTTANSLAWVMFYLANYPEVVSRLRKEAKEVYPNLDVPNTIAQHQHLTYAQAVVQEVIRLKPTSPQLILQAQREVKIGHYVIPAGTNIILQNRIAQVRDAHFFQAEKFMPERWLPKGCPVHANHQPDVVRAFGGGPRYCPGKHLALHEMVLVTSVIAKHFDLEMREHPDEIMEAFSFTMHPTEFNLNLSRSN